MLLPMDPMKALDMERRSGISQQEVDDFANRMDLIAKAMDDVKNGTFDPLKCNIPGYKTPEQEEVERKERAKRDEERCKREEERKRKEKELEHDNWWYKAELRYSLTDEKDMENKEDTSKSERWANRLLAAYKTRDANDYSLWDQWVPEDPVSLQEKAQREAELEKLRNREFESNNPDFCNQFKKDMEERQRSQEEKARTAERLKQQGNHLYKAKRYEDAIKSYMKALLAAPFNIPVLANLAQCYLRLERLDDCIEFCSRTLYIDANHVKALSRRATAWHRLKRLKEAAEDMRKAFALDGENEDIIEQHSIIVGDYEDSITNHELEAALSKHRTRSVPSSLSSIEELRFSLELFEKVEEQERAMSTSDESQQYQVQDAYVAYDLLLPVMEKNEHVRAKFRTSGEMDKLCDRIVNALNVPIHTEKVDATYEECEELILSAMINCAAAAVANTPRNQVVMYRHENFRKGILASFAEWSKKATSTSWIIQLSLIRFLEQVVDSKSWRNMVLSSNTVISSLLAALCLGINDHDASNSNNSSKTFIRLTASSLCFTLSNDSAGIQAFASRGVHSLAAVVQTLETKECSNSIALWQNVLGFMTNLSTDKGLRTTIESNHCKETRQNLIRVLLQVAQGENRRQSALESDFVCSERALGALLNLSFSETSLVRTRDLLAFGAVDLIEQVFTQASRSSFPASMLTLSRTASLLCRLHSVCQGEEDTEKKAVQSRLASRKLLSKLYKVCEYANASLGDNHSVLDEELWQLCAQIWCHLGWCVHLSSVRAFLHEKKVVPLLTQVIAIASDHKAYQRPCGKTTACERLVGNVVKVLIALQSDKDLMDSQALHTRKSLKVLVTALQELADGVARKNVAILLAKLCQDDSKVKDLVRDLRGIDMMLAVSQSFTKCPAVASC